MLPVVAFIVFWVVLGFSVFFIAVRGGPRGARDTLQGQSPAARRVATISFLVIYVGFGAAMPVVFLRGNNAHCAVCHTLAAANAVGKVGPNLDMLRPPESLVLHTINNGCLQKPPTTSSPQNCLGQGNMAAQIVQGSEAQQVSQFVARVAGKE
jgi:hypothetical protein